MEHEIFLYPYSKAEAGRRGELDRWEESFRANVSCAREIEAVIGTSETSSGWPMTASAVLLAPSGAVSAAPVWVMERKLAGIGQISLVC